METEALVQKENQEESSLLGMERTGIRAKAYLHKAETARDSLLVTRGSRAATCGRDGVRSVHGAAELSLG
jgi:hypothetical protein